MNQQLSDKTIQLDEKGKETLIALLTYKTRTKAAEALQISRDTLYKRIESYGLNEIIIKIPEEALQTLQIASTRAAEIIVDKLDDQYGPNYEVAKEILDRVGIIRRTEASLRVQNNILNNPQAILGGMSVEFVGPEEE